LYATRWHTKTCCSSRRYGRSRKLISQYAAYLGSLRRISAQRASHFPIAGGRRIVLNEFSQGHSCGFSVSNTPAYRDSLATGEEGKKMSANISAGESKDKRSADDLAKRRLGVAVTLSLAMIAIYFGFMGLFAFDKPLLGTILAPGLSLCIILGPVVIISSFLLCLIYVRWANRVYDPGVAALKR
jgi:uncharacterized membrane protein (DUF485 family)